MRRRGLEYHSRHGTTTKALSGQRVRRRGPICLPDTVTKAEKAGSAYLKGIPLAQLRTAIDCVTWPELDLSRLYTRDAGDERWPLQRRPCEIGTEAALAVRCAS